MGLDLVECWWSRSRRNWFGQQSRFDVPPPALWLNGHAVVMVVGLFGTRTCMQAPCRQEPRIFQGPSRSGAVQPDHFLARGDQMSSLATCPRSSDLRLRSAAKDGTVH